MEFKLNSVMIPPEFINGRTSRLRTSFLLSVNYEEAIGKLLQPNIERRFASG